jgi:hypothetical protein
MCSPADYVLTSSFDWLKQRAARPPRVLIIETGKFASLTVVATVGLVAAACITQTG